MTFGITFCNRKPVHNGRVSIELLKSRSSDENVAKTHHMFVKEFFPLLFNRVLAIKSVRPDYIIRAVWFPFCVQRTSPVSSVHYYQTRTIHRSNFEQLTMKIVKRNSTQILLTDFYLINVFHVVKIICFIRDYTINTNCMSNT